MYIHNNIVEDVRQHFKDKLAARDYITDKTGVKTIELVNANFIADQPTIFGEPNEDYIKREIAWYKSQSLNIADIPGGAPAIWKQVADSSGYINSNYGWCIWNANNYSQYTNVLDELIRDPNSRRAIMIYTRPNMWNDYKEHGRSDFMCTNAVQYLIRKDKIEAVVQMRSNDVVFGYRNDYAWQQYVLSNLSDRLGIACGNIYWNVGSLHVYDRHFDLVK